MECVAGAWDTRDYCLSVADQTDPDRLAETAYQAVCRSDFSRPGFCLIALGVDANSRAARRLMVELYNALHLRHRRDTGRDLAVMLAGRFDQQTTTKLHRDGGAEQSVLLLGYEPTPVRSELAIADYSRCAHDHGMAPAELLDRHNPMFNAGARMLEPYTTAVRCFSHDRYCVLLLNNSVADYSSTSPAWQGVLHTARIDSPSDVHRRVVNSMMVASTSPHSKEGLRAEEFEDFVTTDIVHCRF